MYMKDDFVSYPIFVDIVEAYSLIVIDEVLWTIPVFILTITSYVIIFY